MKKYYEEPSIKKIILNEGDVIVTSPDPEIPLDPQDPPEPGNG